MHLKYPRAVLKTMAHAMKAKGRGIISVPNEATLFHRLRAFFGVVDAECFEEKGKHLHLPNLKQARNLVGDFFCIEKEVYYIHL